MELMENSRRSEFEPEDKEQAQSAAQAGAEREAGEPGGQMQEEATTPASVETPEVSVPRKRRKKKDTIDPEKLKPPQSIWPIVLALAIVVMCIGLMFNLIV